MANETEMTYLKEKYKKENLTPHRLCQIDLYAYEIANGDYPVEPSLRTKSRRFVCDHGYIWYTYNHFPDNCGIGVYSNIIPSSDLTKELSKEFVHFIQHTCNKDMILLSDHLNGTVDQIAAFSDGELNPIGRRVVNDNTDNYIKIYQTTRKSQEHMIDFDIEYIRPGLKKRSR